jgi:hypothetical protein
MRFRDRKEKTNYIELIKQAGFKDVQVIEETTMPIETLFSEETAKQVLKELKMTKEKALELLGAAVSIKVSAIKPN